jgi:hypothetical protein
LLGNYRLRSGGLDAVCLKQSFIVQQSGYANALLHKVDRRTRQLEPVDLPIVALEGEAPAVAQEKAGLFDPARAGQSVASIARAA